MRVPARSGRILTVTGTFGCQLPDGTLRIGLVQAAASGCAEPRETVFRHSDQLAKHFRAHGLVYDSVSRPGRRADQRGDGSEHPGYPGQDQRQRREPECVRCAVTATAIAATLSMNSPVAIQMIRTARRMPWTRLMISGSWT